jgi:predicted Zn-dependent protease
MSRLDQIQQMLQKEPGDVFLNFALAMEYVKLARPEEAVTQFKHVVTLDPNYTAAYFQQGNVLINLGRLDDAGTALREGIAIAQRIGDQHAAGEMSEVLATLG